MFYEKIFEFEGNQYTIQLLEESIIFTAKRSVKYFHGVVVMSSADNIQTRNDSIKWKKEVHENCVYPDGKEMPCILVENNIDLIPFNDWSDETFKDFWKMNGFTYGFRVSSKTGLYVNYSMEYFVKEIIKRIMNINKKIKIGEIDVKSFDEENKTSLEGHIKCIRDRSCILL